MHLLHFSNTICLLNKDFLIYYRNVLTQGERKENNGEHLYALVKSI